jgi:CBS domain-containing protein
MLIEEVIEFLRKIPPFQFLDDTTLKNITSDLSMEFYPKGTTIQYQDGPTPNYLYIIKKGAVKVFITKENEEVFVDYRGEGDLIGYMLIFGGDKARATVTAADDTICYLIKRENIQNLLYSNPDIREFFHKSFLTRYLEKTFKEIQNKSLVYGGSDKILFTMPVGELASKDIIQASHHITIQEAAQIMADYRISSLILVDEKSIPTGIVTDRDLRDKVVSKGKSSKDPVKDIMSVPHIKSDEKEYCFEAILKMVRNNVHHLLVMKGNKLQGILTNHDLMLIQGTSPLSIVKDIESQNIVDALIPVSKRITNIIGILLSEGAKASITMRIVTEINDRLVKRILEIAEERFGKPPVPYCFFVSGSEGRKEQTFITEQDNAIIYQDPVDSKSAETAQEYFGLFTQFVKDGLIKCGFPPCPSDFMASNPQWCQPLNIWRKYFMNWITTPTSNVARNNITLFDFRAIHGDITLFEWFKDSVLSLIKDNRGFLRYVANIALKHSTPVGFLKSFVVEKSGEHKEELDIKQNGLIPLIDLARLFALEKGVPETSTVERINALRDTHPIVSEYADELIHAFEFIMLLRIKHQFEQVQKGIDIDNLIQPHKLSNLEKRISKETFQLISKVQDLIIDEYTGDMSTES